MPSRTEGQSYEIGTATTDIGSDLNVDVVGKYVPRGELQAPAVTLSWVEYDDEDELAGVRYRSGRVRGGPGEDGHAS